MEYVAIEKEAIASVEAQIQSLINYVTSHTPQGDNLQATWIENGELARSLNLSLRTLQGYRERGVLGFSIIGRKIYYKTSDIQVCIDSGVISTKTSK